MELHVAELMGQIDDVAHFHNAVVGSGGVLLQIIVSCFENALVLRSGGAEGRGVSNSGAISPETEGLGGGGGGRRSGSVLIEGGSFKQPGNANYSGSLGGSP